MVSVANLAPVLGISEDRVRDMLGALRRDGWVTSVVRGMTERRQHRWFLTRRAVDLLYVTGHQHPAPREEARAADLAALHPGGELPEDCRERFALDHDHPAHTEDQAGSTFAAGDTAGQTGASAIARAGGRSSSSNVNVYRDVRTPGRPVRAGPG